MLCTTPKSGGTALWEIYASDMSMNAVWRGAAFQGIFGLGWKDTDRNETTVLESMGTDQPPPHLASNTDGEASARILLGKEM